MSMRSRFLLIAISAAALTACNTTSNHVSAVSSASAMTHATLTTKAAQVQEQTIAPGLYELAYSAKQDAVFVVSAGGFGPDAPASEVLRLDPHTLAIQARVKLPLKGFGVVLDDQANRLYVGNGLEGSITVLDTQSLQIQGTIALAEKIKGDDGKEKFEHHFRQLVLDPANHRLYAPGLSIGDSALYVVNTQTLQVEKVVRGFGQVAAGVSLDAKGQRLFVSNLRGGLYEVSTKNLSITKAHQVQADQLINLTFDAQSGRLFATDQGLPAINERRQKIEPDFVPTPGNRLIEFNPDTGAIIASADAGQGPIALLLDPHAQAIFVTNRGSGSVTVHDAKSLATLQTVALKDHPNSLAYDAKKNVLYVTVKNGQGTERGAAEKVARVAF